MMHYVLTVEYKRNIHSQMLLVSREISNTYEAGVFFFFLRENTISRKLLLFFGSFRVFTSFLKARMSSSLSPFNPYSRPKMRGFL